MKQLFSIIALITCFAFAGQSQDLYQPALDTLTNTEADTLTYSFPNNRNFDYLWMVQLTAISGTDSVSVKIEETACRTCTTWKAVGNTDLLGGASTTNQIAWELGTVYGVRQRIILTGIGTQSTKYRVYAAFRRKP